MKVRTLPYRDKEELSLSVEVRSMQSWASQRDTKATSDKRQLVELSSNRSMPAESSCNKKADPRAQQQPQVTKELVAGSLIVSLRFFISFPHNLFLISLVFLSLYSLCSVLQIISIKTSSCRYPCETL